MKKILIVEDEPDIRNTIITVLKNEGYETLSAESGEKGVQLAFEQNPDLILCDIMLPKMDGLEVFSEINHLSNRSITPFIFLTAKTDKIDIRNAMHLGAADYITKPFEINDLLHSIKIQLTKKEEIIERIQDEKIRLLAKLETEILARDLEIEKLKKAISVKEEKLEPPVKIEKKQTKSSSNILLLMENILFRLRFTIAIRKNFSSNVIEVSTLEKAVTIAENITIDYIIIDHFGSNDALKIARLIRRKFNLLHAPILVFAEHIEKEFLIDFAKLGNIDFMLHPFDPDNLVQKISKYISILPSSE